MSLVLNIDLSYCALLHSYCRYSESRRWWFGKFGNYFSWVPAVFCICVRTPFRICLIYSSLKICFPSFLLFCWQQVHIYKYLQILSRSFCWHIGNLVRHYYVLSLSPLISWCVASYTCSQCSDVLRDPPQITVRLQGLWPFHAPQGLSPA